MSAYDDYMRVMMRSQQAGMQSNGLDSIGGGLANYLGVSQMQQGMSRTPAPAQYERQEQTNTKLLLLEDL